MVFLGNRNIEAEHTEGVNVVQFKVLSAASVHSLWIRPSVFFSSHNFSFILLEYLEFIGI